MTAGEFRAFDPATLTSRRDAAIRDSEFEVASVKEILLKSIDLAFLSSTRRAISLRSRAASAAGRTRAARIWIPRFVVVAFLFPPPTGGAI